MNEPKVTLEQTIPLNCGCGNKYFNEGILFRKVSKILAGTTQDAIIPINVYLCTSCGEPLEEMLPKNLSK